MKGASCSLEDGDWGFPHLQGCQWVPDNNQQSVPGPGKHLDRVGEGKLTNFSQCCMEGQRMLVEKQAVDRVQDPQSPAAPNVIV